MTTTVHEETINGVEVEGLKDTIARIRQDPALARFQFRASNRWLSGSRNRSRVEGFHGAGRENAHPSPFELDSDEPEVLLGGDTAPNPVEYLLHALAGCVVTTMVCHAAARGIRIESLECSLEGDIDIQGFLGISDSVPRGFRTIRVTLRARSDAPAERLAELARYSPVLNTITSATPVEVKVEKV